MRLRAGFWFLGFTLLIPNADAESVLTPELERKLETLSLEEILNIKVVTAAKYTQSRGDSPSTVTVITAEDIGGSGETTLADLLKGTAGMDVSYSSERKFAVAARGLSGGSFSKRILFLIDGRPINAPSSGEAYVGYPISLHNIAQIEIIRGPGSSLYGGNAYAGVVNIITKKPADGSRLAHGLFSYGSFGRASGAVTVGQKKGDFGLTLSGTYLRFDEDGVRDKWPGATTVPDDFKGYDVMGRLEYKGLTAEAGYNDYDMPVTEKGQYTLETSFMRYEKNHLGFGQVQWEHKLSDKLSGSAKAYYNDFFIDRFDLYNQPGEVKETGTNRVLRSYAAGDRRWAKTPSEETSWGGGIQMDWAPLPHHRLIVGADYLKQTVDQENLRSTDGTPDPALDYYSGKYLSATGIFVQDELSLMRDRLVLTGGVRYDKYSEFERNLSPRLSAVYKFKTHGRLRAAYGEAFRIPSLAEYHYTLYQYQRNNLDWKFVPEKIRTYEAAGSYTFEKQQLAFTLTGFRNEVPNMILNTGDRIDEQFPFLYFYYNFDKKVTSQGLELEAEKRLGSHIALRANYTYQRARDEDGGVLIEAPDHKLNVDARTTWGKVFGNVGLGFVGPRYDYYYYSRYVNLDRQPVENGSSRLRSYAVVDMRVGFRLNSNASLEVAGRNLLDAEYYDKGHNVKYDVGYRSLDSRTRDYTRVNAPTDDYRNRSYWNPGRAVRAELRLSY